MHFVNGGNMALHWEKIRVKNVPIMTGGERVWAFVGFWFLFECHHGSGTQNTCCCVNDYIPSKRRTIKNPWKSALLTHNRTIVEQFVWDPVAKVCSRGQ